MAAGWEPKARQVNWYSWFTDIADPSYKKSTLVGRTERELLNYARKMIYYHAILEFAISIYYSLIYFRIAWIKKLFLFHDQYDITVSIIQLLEEIKVLQDCKDGQIFWMKYLMHFDKFSYFKFSWEWKVFSSFMSYE